MEKEIVNLYTLKTNGEKNYIAFGLREEEAKEIVEEAKRGVYIEVEAI